MNITTTFNLDQAVMAIFLSICFIASVCFVIVTARKVVCHKAHHSSSRQTTSRRPTSRRLTTCYDLLNRSTFVMALLDIPWVTFCLIQYWYDVFSSEDKPFNPKSGEDNIGCKFMGWCSSFSLISMMGSHCLVVYYLLRYIRETRQQSRLRNHDDDGSHTTSHPHLGTTEGFNQLVTMIVITACLFGSMPLLQGDGYIYTNAGFCYANFTNTIQSCIIFIVVTALLSLATDLWTQIGITEEWGVFYAIFFLTWFLWIPATIYGMYNGEQIPYPYLLIGAIAGHGTALINPFLYGIRMFNIIEDMFVCDRHMGGDFEVLITSVSRIGTDEDIPYMLDCETLRPQSIGLSRVL